MFLDPKYVTNSELYWKYLLFWLIWQIIGINRAFDIAFFRKIWIGIFFLHRYIVPNDDVDGTSKTERVIKIFYALAQLDGEALSKDSPYHSLGFHLPSDVHEDVKRIYLLVFSI